MKFWLKLSLLLPAAALILSGCEEEQHTHRYESVIAEPASCAADGVMQYTCACGDSYSEAIPAAEAHAWDDGEITPATCGETGTASYTCTVCSEKKDETLPAAGEHTWGQASVVKAATCGAAGEVTASCTVCAETMRTEIAKLTAHSFGNMAVTKAATCGEDGESASVCTLCGEKKTAVVAKTGAHTWDSGTVTKAATCAAEGVKTVHCTVCDEKKEESLPKTTAHAWKSTGVQTAAACGAAGKEGISCTVCGTASTRSIPATGAHNWDAGKITTASTCYQEGVITHTCTACGQTKTSSSAKTADHRWNGGVTTRAATCGREGVTTYTCSLCRTTKTESIPKTENHNWTEKVTTQPTVTTGGVKTVSCTVCGKSHTENIGTLTFDPDKYKDPYRVRTSNRTDSYIEYAINGDTLTVSGVVKKDGLQSLILMYGRWEILADAVTGDSLDSISARVESKYIFEMQQVDVTSGSYFTMQVPLHQIQENEQVPIFLLFDVVSEQSYSLQTNVAVEKVNGTYRFAESPVLDHNLRMMATPLDPNDYVSEYSAEIKKLSDQIVGGETDDARKLYLLYKWVSENVYSDTSTSSQTDAYTAFTTRRGTSSGYTSLLIALIRSQGIPAIRVGIYRSADNGTGLMSDTDAAVITANYNCVEAYLASENRWVLMDPTAASKNKMDRGSAQKNPMDDAHFDITPWQFAKNSKILERPRSW